MILFHQSIPPPRTPHLPLVPRQISAWCTLCTQKIYVPLVEITDWKGGKECNIKFLLKIPPLLSTDYIPPAEYQVFVSTPLKYNRKIQATTIDLNFQQKL